MAAQQPASTFAGSISVKNRHVLGILVQLTTDDSNRAVVAGRVQSSCSNFNLNVAHHNLVLQCFLAIKLGILF